MKKFLLILLIACTFNNNVNAQKERGETYPKFTFGLEWGYVASITTVFHNNFYAPEGFRVDEQGIDTGYINNADMYLNVGWNVNPVWNVSIYIGYAGVGDMHNVLPISIRGTRYFGSAPLKDRWFIFADAGGGICLKTPVQDIATLKFGGGYQLSLSRDTKLNFLISTRSTYTHPSIYFDGNRIPMNRTNRNNAVVAALSAGIGLSF